MDRMSIRGRLNDTADMRWIVPRVPSGARGASLHDQMKLLTFAGHDGNQADHRHVLAWLQLDQLDLGRRSGTEKAACTKLLTKIIPEVEEIHGDSLARLEGFELGCVALIDPDRRIFPSHVRRIHDLDVGPVPEDLNGKDINRVELVGIGACGQLRIEIR